MSQLLVLSKIYEGKQSYSEIANALGMTLQGVLYHVNALKENNFLGDDGHVTQAGYEHLYNGLKELSDLISKDLDSLHGNLVWEALASSEVKKGEKLGLGMRAGYLNAGHNETGSAEGIVDRDASPGNVVGIEEVRGIIGYDTGEVRMIILPDVESVQDFAEISRKVKGVLLKDSKIGTIGEEAWRVGKDLGNIDFEYGVLEASYDAAVRGLNTSILVSKRRFSFLSRKLTDFSEQFPQIRISFHSI